MQPLVCKEILKNYYLMLFVISKWCLLMVCVHGDKFPLSKATDCGKICMNQIIVWLQCLTDPDMLTFIYFFFLSFDRWLTLPPVSTLELWSRAALKPTSSLIEIRACVKSMITWSITTWKMYMTGWQKLNLGRSSIFSCIDLLQNTHDQMKLYSEDFLLYWINT